MDRRTFLMVASSGIALMTSGSRLAMAGSERLELDGPTRERCLAVLREGLDSPEFWPSMHAAEALTLAGEADRVRSKLGPELEAEKDDQKRSGLARELVRAGDWSKVAALVEILTKSDPFGHVHACESLYKVGQLGDGAKLREAFEQTDSPNLAIMAAAALQRWGHPRALDRLREFVGSEDGEIARITAWVLTQVGNSQDLEALRAGLQRFSDPLTRAYFEHALAALGDEEGKAALAKNLGSDDPAIRVQAAEFAPKAGAAETQGRLLALLDDPDLDVRIRAADAILQLAKPLPDDSESGFSRDIFPAKPENPRYSEGSVIVLRDGRLLYATTEFEGRSDFAQAHLIAVESTDSGRSWSNRRILQENVGGQNVMSATLQRLTDAPFDGPIGLFYLVKNSYTDLRVYLRISEDEGTTFGDPIRVTADPGYHVLNNDRVTRLSTGRLVAPVATTPDVRKGGVFESVCYLSDDQGQTWRRGKQSVPYPKRGAMEPEVLELKDGRLLMHIRTQLNHIAFCESDDGGETWSEPKSWGVQAPESPSTLRRIPTTGDLLLIWNDNVQEGFSLAGARTPLTAAISTDEGKTWTFRRNLETHPEQAYAYTSLVFNQGQVLLTYYIGEGNQISSRFRSLPISWFYEEEP